MEKLSERELHALVSLLDDPDMEIKDHVKDRIISLGNEIIPFLEEKWENSFNPDLQKEIEELVHLLQFKLLKERLSNWKDAKEQDLLTGLWIINTYQYPDMDFESLNASMHQLYFEVWASFNNDLPPHEKIKTINNVLFGTLKFSANTKNFHSPGNSMLSNVMETKKGNPISLCAVYLLVARKLGLPVFGVNLPNLFVLTYKSDKATFYINAFNKGLIFSRQDIQNYLDHLKINPREEYFEPCESIEIIKRTLRNLIVGFEKLGETEKTHEIKILLEILMD